ncbi:MAG: hypothetical protein JW745_03085, partial [Sedimentisphaerales bacterium]|nr:hypothetical protein [Sedimentisphaerales bacterium]
NTTCYALYFKVGSTPSFTMVHSSTPDWDHVVANISSSYFVNGSYSIPDGYQRERVKEELKLFRLVKSDVKQP